MLYPNKFLKNKLQVLSAHLRLDIELGEDAGTAAPTRTGAKLDRLPYQEVSLRRCNKIFIYRLSQSSKYHNFCFTL